MNKIFLLLTLLFGLQFDLSAQEIVTDRPDQTVSSTTIPFRSIQIESGFLLGYSNDNTITERQLFLPTNLFRYGLTKSIELRLVAQLENYKIEETSFEKFGVSDLELGTKIQILKNNTINTEITFLSHLIIPSGSNGLTFGTFGTVNKIAVSHPINDRFDIGYNMGYNYFGSGNGDFSYSVALGYGITKKAGFYLETYGEIVNFDSCISNFDTGVTYLIQKNFKADFSFGSGLNQKMNYLSIGCSWNLKRY